MRKVAILVLVLGVLISSVAWAEDRKEIVSAAGLHVYSTSDANGREIYVIEGTLESVAVYDNNPNVLMVKFKNLQLLPCGGHIFADNSPIITQMLIQASMSQKKLQVVVRPGVLLPISKGSASASNKIVSVTIEN